MESWEWKRRSQKMSVLAASVSSRRANGLSTTPFWFPCQPVTLRPRLGSPIVTPWGRDNLERDWNLSDRAKPWKLTRWGRRWNLRRYNRGKLDSKVCVSSSTLQLFVGLRFSRDLNLRIHFASRFF